MIGWQRSHNVYGQHVPWPLRLDGSSRLLTVAIIATQLTLGTTLCNFKADAATGFIVVSIVEELPQRLPPVMGGRVELSCKIQGFVLIFHEANLEENVFWWWRVDGQPAETIDMGLRLPKSKLYCKVVLLQLCWPAVEERGPCPHCLEPLQRVMVRINLEWHSHEARTELHNGPDNSETFQFSGGVGLLSLVEWPWGTTDDTLFALPDLRQYCAEACSRRVRIQMKGLAKVGKGSDRAGGEECFQAVEGILAVSAPMKDLILPSQRMQLAGDCCEILHIMPVIPGKTQEGADFSGGFGRRNLPDGCKEHWIRQEALFCGPVPQITDLLGGESAFLGAKF